MPGFMDELAIYVISLISLPPFWFWEVSNQWRIVAALAGAQSFFLCLLMNEGLMKGGGPEQTFQLGHDLMKNMPRNGGQVQLILRLLRTYIICTIQFGIIIK